MFVRKTFGRAIVDSMAGMSRLRLLGLGLAIAVACSGIALTNASLAQAAGETTTYTGTETISVPPASNFAGSGGGDGWSVALSNTQVFNVFHHSGSLQVVCHNQADASVCWGTASNSGGVETITDASGNNFATSGHPGMYLDPNSGKLWVYATRSSSDATQNATAGVVCIDTSLPVPASGPDVNRFCGFVALTNPGEAPLSGGISGLSNPMQFGDRLYAFNYVNSVDVPVGAQNAMLCFDVSTDQACQGQPYTVNAGVGVVSVNSFPTPATALISSELIVPITVNNTKELACLDANTNGNCNGSWPASIASTNYTPGGEGSPFPLLDASGNTTGLCLPDSTDECFGLDGSSTPTPSGMAAAIGGGSASWDGPGLILGPRVYVPAWTNIVYCYDAATNAACADPTTGQANFPKFLNSLSLLYTVNADPQRPGCIWVNSDTGSQQIQNFDAFTGGPCNEATRGFMSQFVNSGSQCAPSSFKSLQIVSPSGVQGTITFEDSDGNPIGQPQTIPANGTIDLTGLKLTSGSQFVVNFGNSDQRPPSQLVIALSWNAPFDPSCIDDDDVASNPVITATGNGISATEGASFSGAVASFKDPDSSGKAGDYSASINWGDGSTSAGTISGTPSKFTVSASHTYAEEGSFTATVTITDKDGSGNNATVHDKATVADAALHATGATPSLSGTTASGTVATFTDADPNGTVSDYTASINWGDGTTTTGTVSKRAAHAVGTSGGFTVSGSHNYGKSGTFTIKTTIKDAGGSTATATTTIAAQVKAARVSARLSSVPNACVTRAFTLRVHGTRIASVRFTLDGRRLASRTVHRGTEYAARIASHPGRHSLTVRIKFRAGSAARSRTLHRTVVGCALPKFTG